MNFASTLSKWTSQFLTLQGKYRETAPDQVLNKKYALIAILLIVIFSATLRALWFSHFSNSPEYEWNENLLLTTNDAFHYAASAKIAAEGNIHNNPSVLHDKPFGANGAIIATAWAANKVFGIDIDAFALYSPMILSGITGALVFLIGHALGLSVAGFIGGLVAVSSKIFYVRTRAGYFDTDLLALLVPLLLIYLLISFYRYKNLLYILAASLLLVVQEFFYVNNPLISESIIVLLFLYITVFQNKSTSSLAAALILLPPILAIDLPSSIRIAMILGIYYWTTHNKLSIDRLQKIALIGVIAVMPMSHLAEYGWDKFTYFSNPGSSAASQAISFSYTNVAETVDEIQRSDVSTVVDLAFNGWFWLALGLLGLLLVVLRRSESIGLIALLALGATSFGSGERFSIYAVPVLALGLGYTFWYFSNLAISRVSQDLLSKTPAILKDKSRISLLLISILTFTALYESVSFANQYNAPPVMYNDEAAVLDAIGKNSSPYDKIIAWWDYGYEIHNFAGRQSIASGAASPETLFALSTIFSSPDQLTSNTVSKILSESSAQPIDAAMRKNLIRGQGIFNNLLSLLSEETHNKFIYIPVRMLDIFPTIYSMSPYAKDIVSGARKGYTLYIAQNAQKTNNEWLLDGNIKIDVSNGKMISSQGETTIASYIELSAANGSKPVINKTEFKNPASRIHLVFMPEYRKVILVDDNVLQSAFIQMFFFENFDENQFSLRIRNNFAKVFLVK